MSRLLPLLIAGGLSSAPAQDMNPRPLTLAPGLTVKVVWLNPAEVLPRDEQWRLTALNKAFTGVVSSLKYKCLHNPKMYFLLFHGIGTTFPEFLTLHAAESGYRLESQGHSDGDNHLIFAKKTDKVVVSYMEGPLSLLVTCPAQKK